MMTTRGEMAEESLRKKVVKEAVPCGTCVTTSFYAEDGELVRQDIAVEVDPALVGLKASTGRI